MMVRSCFGWWWVVEINQSINQLNGACEIMMVRNLLQISSVKVPIFFHERDVLLNL